MHLATRKMLWLKRTRGCDFSFDLSLSIAMPTSLWADLKPCSTDVRNVRGSPALPVAT